MRIVFLGSGAFGLPTLQALSASAQHQVVGVVSQPDKPAGRGGTLTATPIAQWASTHLPGVPLIRSPKISVGDDAARVRAIDADAWLVIAFGQKLSPDLLAGKRAINLHASLLPRWRGAAPINAAIVAGDTVTGNSVITLADTMDAGLVLGQTTRPIDPTRTAGELHDLLAQDGPELVLRVLSLQVAGTLAGSTQDESRVTIAPKMSKGDGVVDFMRPASECRARVHGLTPWPGVTVAIAGEAIKLLRVRDEPGPNGQGAPPGTLVSAREGVVACAAGVLRLLEVQPAGKKAMAWSDFVRGRGGLADGARVSRPEGGGA